MDPISQLELASIHEAAHVVLAVNCRWHFLCGSVSVNSEGHGAAPFQMDNVAAKDEFRASGNADRVFLKAAVIAAAGVCAENRLLRERGEKQLALEEAFLASPADVDQANSALDNMVVPTSFAAIVQETQAVIDSNEGMWQIIRQFADLLRDLRTFTPREATDTVLEIEKNVSQRRAR
jgi:hypothetical protein